MCQELTLLDQSTFDQDLFIPGEYEFFNCISASSILLLKYDEKLNNFMFLFESGYHDTNLTKIDLAIKRIKTCTFLVRISSQNYNFALIPEANAVFYIWLSK